MKKNALAYMVGVAALALSGNASAFLIDDFNAPTVSIFDVDGAGPVSNGGVDVGLLPGGAGPGTVGSTRSVSALITTPLIAGLGGSAGVAVGNYTHNSDGSVQIQSILTWVGDGSGLGGVNLTDGLINGRFEFVINQIDQGNVDIKITVEDTLGSGLVSFTESNLGVGTESVAFSNFAGVDFTSIDFISLEVIQLADASDLSLDIFSTSGDQPPPPPSGVPVPAAVWLFGTGLVGLMGATRRKKA